MSEIKPLYENTTTHGKQNIYFKTLKGGTIKRSTTNMAMRYIAQTGTDELAVQFHPNNWYVYKSAKHAPGTVAAFANRLLSSEGGTPHSFGKIAYQMMWKNKDVITKKIKPGSPEHIKLTTKFGSAENIKMQPKPGKI